ncbi:unnamed protein product [Ilex paraguariensis]|uniref:Uncharacterized protein n=1 Tax=Ilex paraguariensis TaxID=185542 RepID=A0ABC8RFK1_9AQUA
MDALGGGGNGWIWGMLPFQSQQPRSRSRNKKSKSSDSVEATGGAGYRFPLKQAATAASLALAGDTIAQLRVRWVKNKANSPHSIHDKENVPIVLSQIGLFKYCGL